MSYKFPLGRIVATPGAIAAVPDERLLQIMLANHALGGWGRISDEEKAANDAALDPTNPQRVMSSYAIDLGKPCKGYGDNTVWIITEWDRSVTTVLLPEEY